MTGGDDKFYAWLDGELSSDEAAAMAARVAADPELARLAEEDRALRDRLGSAFGTIIDQPVPERVVESLRAGAGAQVVDFGAKREERNSRRAGVPQWMAIAASLAVGLFIGATALDNDPGGTVTMHDGPLYAAAALEAGLTEQLASAPAKGPLRIGVTYRNQAGAICRSFSSPASSGIACRDEGRWRLEALLAARENDATTFRMASGIDPALAEVIASTIAGEPFDARAERAAKSSGWKK